MEKRQLKNFVNNSEVLYSYLKEKAVNHPCYKYYSSLDRIEQNFMRTQSLFLSMGSKWNDRSDFERFNDDQLSIARFGMCFSYSKSESVPMWMLYGGLKHTGAMIDFPPKMMKSIVNDTEKVYLGYFKDGEYKECGNYQSNEFNIFIQDVLYFGDSSKEKNMGTYYVKRSDETVDGVSMNVIGDNRIIKKRIGWSYENETRLIVEINKEIINNSDGIGTNSANTSLIIKIPFDNIQDISLSDKIVLAPNYNGCSRDYRKSNLTRELEWDLCDSCCFRTAEKIEP